MAGKYMINLAGRGGCQFGGPPEFRHAHKRTHQPSDSPWRKRSPPKFACHLTSKSRNSPGEGGIGLSMSAGAKVGRGAGVGGEGGGLGLGKGVSFSDLGLGSSIRKSLCCPGVLGPSTQRPASLGNSTPRAVVVGGNRTGPSCCCLVGAKAQAPDMRDLWFTHRC